MLEQTVRAIDNPTIDANWDKAAWRGVSVMMLGHFMGNRPTHRPLVQVKMGYDSEHVYLIWRVEDRFVLARCTEHQQPVCLDSCVEFFFTPGGAHEQDGYFNIETNCCGLMWASRCGGGRETVMLPPEDLARIEVATSLTGPIIDEIVEPTTWTLEARLPLAVLEKHAHVIRPRAGVTWRGNFYKCADETSDPHWLTWSPVDWPAPAFHLPAQFGTLRFE